MSAVSVTPDMAEYNTKLLDMADEFRRRRLSKLAALQRQREWERKRAELAESPDGFLNESPSPPREDSPVVEAPREKSSSRLRVIEPRDMKLFEVIVEGFYFTSM